MRSDSIQRTKKLPFSLPTYSTMTLTPATGPQVRPHPHPHHYSYSHLPHQHPPPHQQSPHHPHRHLLPPPHHHLRPRKDSPSVREGITFSTHPFPPHPLPPERTHTDTRDRCCGLLARQRCNWIPPYALGCRVDGSAFPRRTLLCR